MSLIIKNVSKAFNNSLVLRDIIFELKNGELITINGKNGIGKTTLCNLVAKLITPDSGSIHITNQNSYQANIGYSSSNEIFFYKLNVYENLEFFLTMRGIKKKQCISIIKRYLDLFELKKDFLNTPFSNLSSGEKKKFSINKMYGP